MNIISVMFPNDLAEVTVDKGEGVQVLIGKAEGEKEKSIIVPDFSAACRRGDLLWRNYDLCQGWKGRQGAARTEVCANND